MLPYLSLAIWVPIVAGILVLAIHRDRDAAAARWLALVGAVAGLAVTIPLYTRFALGTAEMQFVETIEWIPRFNVNYLLGVDGISVLLILLNSRLNSSRSSLYKPLISGLLALSRKLAVPLYTRVGVRVRKRTTSLSVRHSFVEGYVRGYHYLVPMLQDKRVKEEEGGEEGR